MSTPKIAAALSRLHVDHQLGSDAVWRNVLEGSWWWPCRLCRPVRIGRCLSWEAAYAEAAEHLAAAHASVPVASGSCPSGAAARAE
jgi:hypothetical protein